MTITEEPTVRRSRLKGHEGQMLINYANVYKTLMEVVQEAVQNALDSNAMRIVIFINRQRRTITVCDNGDGASVERFNLALRSVGKTQKGDQPDKLGRFGIGLISPLDKCLSFTFTSTPRGGDGVYHRWTFVTEEIRQMADDADVPLEDVPELQFGATEKSKTIGSQKVSQVTWRTMVSIKQYSADRIVNRIDSADHLIKHLFINFSDVMREKGVKLDVTYIATDGTKDERKNVTPPDYTGDPLEFVLFHDDLGNSAHFRLFLAQRDFKGKGKGEVKVGTTDNPYRFSFSLFAKAHGEYLTKDAKAALLSGLFEGNITSSGVVLLMERNQFAKSEAVKGFCDSINLWFETVGSEYVDAVTTAQRDERYQKIGAEALASVMNVLKQGDYGPLLELLDEALRTSEGAGYVESDETEKVVGKESVYRRGERRGVPPEPKPSPDSDTPQVTRNQFVVKGPKGPKAKVVRSDRFGLEFCLSEMPGKDDLWVLEEGKWTIHFNTRHPLWARCDEHQSSRRLMQLMELVAICVLNWVVSPTDYQSRSKVMLNEIIKGQIELLLMSPSFNMKSLNLS